MNHPYYPELNGHPQTYIVHPHANGVHHVPVIMNNHHQSPNGVHMMHQLHHQGFSAPYYLLSSSRLDIKQPPSSSELITLPTDVAREIEKYRDPNNMPFNYNFGVELETISQLHEQRSQEDEEKRKQKQKAEEEAWRSLQKKRTSSLGSSGSLPVSPSPLSTTPPKGNALLDLDFNENAQVTSPMQISRPTTPVRASNHFTAPSHTAKIPTTPTQTRHKSFPTPKHEEVYLKLMEVGLDSDLIHIGLEVLGISDEMKLINFVTDFQRLEDQPDRFPRDRIKHALLMFDCDYQKSLDFLRECQQLTKLGVTDGQVMEALSTFNNDIKQAGHYLSAYQSLKELGFNDMKVREALVMTNNDRDKAIEYLMENS